MFKKRKSKKNKKEKASKRIKITEEEEKANSSEEEPLNLTNFKKLKQEEINSKRCIAASTAEEKVKKQKIWNQKNEEIKMSGSTFKANRNLESGIQDTEELDNVDLAQLELNQDAYERELRRIEISKQIKEGTLDPKVYRGQHGYANYFDRTEEDLKKKQFNGTLGPTKKENYVKESARIDYNPELCKDYFETGHCAFGDTCIFIHDRTDYASGHQLEKDWNNKQRKLHKKLMGKKYGDHAISDSEDDNISTK